MSTVITLTAVGAGISVAAVYVRHLMRGGVVWRPTATPTLTQHAAMPKPSAPAPAPTTTVIIQHADQVVTDGGQGAYLFEAGRPVALRAPAAGQPIHQLEAPK